MVFRKGQKAQKDTAILGLDENKGLTHMSKLLTPLDSLKPRIAEKDITLLLSITDKIVAEQFSNSLKVKLSQSDKQNDGYNIQV
jgi:hypothetical protein